MGLQRRAARGPAGELWSRLLEKETLREKEVGERELVSQTKIEGLGASCLLS